jgi:hypothetical protein
MVTPHQYHLAHLHDRTAVPGLVPNYQEIILFLYLSVLLKQSKYHLGANQSTEVPSPLKKKTNEERLVEIDRELNMKNLHLIFTFQK